MKTKKPYNKNITLVLSILIVFLTSTLTYVFTNIGFQGEWIKYVVITLGIINVVVTLYPLMFFVTFGSQNKVIKQFMNILFNALFLDHIMELKKHNSNLNNYAYRITYYKYYSKHSKWFAIYRIWWNIRFIKDPIRKLEPNYDYLICKYRFGIENGTYINKKTSKSYRIYDDPKYVRGVTGKIYMNNKSVYSSIDNLNINSILKKIINNKTNLSTYDNSLKDKSIDENIEHMKSFVNDFNKVSTNCKIEDNEIEELTKFMEETNTDFNDMFNINNGVHSNHFLGFKVYNKLHDTMGVFTIDAKEDDPNLNFTDIVAKAKDDWLEKILVVFSGLTSQTIIDLSSEEKKRHGERVGD